MTPTDLRSFKLFVQFRGKPMTVAALLWENVRLYLLLVAVFGAMATYFYFSYGMTWAGFIVVAGAVTILRDISYYRRSASIWPSLQQVLDWQKIEEIMTIETTPSSPVEDSESTEGSDSIEEGVFLTSYLEHLKTLRTWLVAYGIGAPVMLVTQQHLWVTFVASGRAPLVVKLFLAGVITQVCLTFLNKTAMWMAAFGERDSDFKKKKRYKLAHWFSRFYLIDFLADLATIVLFSWATWLAFTVLVPARLTPRSSRTQPALAAPMSLARDFSSSFIMQSPVGPLNCFR